MTVKYPGRLGKKRKVEHEADPHIAKLREVFGVYPDSGSGTEDIELMDELRKFYGLEKNEPGVWWKLAYRLALDHVPGFQFDKRSKTGSKEKIPFTHDLHTIAVIQCHIEDGHANSVKKACAYQAEIDGRSSSADVEHLYNYYRNACQRIYGKKSFSKEQFEKQYKGMTIHDLKKATSFGNDLMELSPKKIARLIESIE